MAHQPITRRLRRQHGVIVLTLMLLVLTASTFVLLKGLNDRARSAPSFDESATRAVLQEAKAALIGYAVTYPDKHSGNKGPGRLPCPDYAYQGVTDPIGSADACALGSATETGLFPFQTIDSNEMFDSSGARLWYAVSDNHRASNTGAIVNSETPGTLNVDASSDVVAVIIAPGPALGSQNRNGSNVDDQYVAGKFLEGENASVGDNRFTAVSGDSNNDQVITITRRELMNAVESRVISTVSSALNGYFNDPDGDDDPSGADPNCTTPNPTTCDDGYPWMSPFANPTLSDFSGAVGVRLGHLPIVSAGQPFQTAVNFDWDIDVDGVIVKSGSSPPSDECVRHADCNLTGSPPVMPIGDSGATCTWSGSRAIVCSTVEMIDLGAGNQIQREYAFEFEGINTTISPPNAANKRTLNFNMSTQRIPGSVTTATIRLTDVFIPATGPSLDYGDAVLTLAPRDFVQFLSFNGVAFDLEIDNDDVLYPQTPVGNQSASPGELPNWFVADNWHHLVVVAYAAAESPANLLGDCTVDASCFSVQWDRSGSIPDTTINNARGVVLVAGDDLGGSRPSANLSDYFEGENATSGDGIFAKSAADNSFNDQIRAIDPDG